MRPGPDENAEMCVGAGHGSGADEAPHANASETCEGELRYLSISTIGGGLCCSRVEECLLQSLVHGILQYRHFFSWLDQTSFPRYRRMAVHSTHVGSRDIAAYPLAKDCAVSRGNPESEGLCPHENRAFSICGSVQLQRAPTAVLC